MRLIKPRAELIEQAPGLNGIYTQIELAGRTCYKSEDKRTENSARGFVTRMIKSNHTAMLEHGTVYLKVPFKNKQELFESDYLNDYDHNEYSRWRREKTSNGEENLLITTNLRVLEENNMLNDLKYICEPTEYHVKRYTFKVTTSIGVTREFNRHKLLCVA